MNQTMTIEQLIRHSIQQTLVMVEETMGLEVELNQDEVVSQLLETNPISQEDFDTVQTFYNSELMKTYSLWAEKNAELIAKSLAKALNIEVPDESPILH